MLKSWSVCGAWLGHFTGFVAADVRRRIGFEFAKVRLLTLATDSRRFHRLVKFVDQLLFPFGDLGLDFSGAWHLELLP